MYILSSQAATAYCKQEFLMCYIIPRAGLLFYYSRKHSETKLPWDIAGMQDSTHIKLAQFSDASRFVR